MYMAVFKVQSSLARALGLCLVFLLKYRAPGWGEGRGGAAALRLHLDFQKRKY